MIIHGNKQISERLYARKASEGGGAVRLTNIIRGAQVVFGGLAPNVKDWLEKATTQSILAAFGQTDGKAVIKATNAYLNGIAETDHTKASALAGFINEDPMLVCSLGLQPQGVEMPIRKLVNNDGAYLNVGMEVTSDLRFEVKSTSLQMGAHQGTTSITSPSMYLQPTLAGTTYSLCVDGSWYSTPAIGTSYLIMQLTDTKLIVRDTNGVVKQTVNKSRNINKNIYLCGSNGSNYAFVMNGKNIIAGWFKNNSKEINLLPFTRKEDGANGMIDTVTGTFYQNANTSGYFTIEYTLPDGTPWTPLNQTP